MCVCCAQVCVADVGRFSPMHAAVYNPVDSRLIATANAREGVHLFDLRTPRLYAFGVLVSLGFGFGLGGSGDSDPVA